MFQYHWLWGCHLHVLCAKSVHVLLPSDAIAFCSKNNTQIHTGSSILTLGKIFLLLTTGKVCVCVCVCVCVPHNSARYSLLTCLTLSLQILTSWAIITSTANSCLVSTMHLQVSSYVCGLSFSSCFSLLMYRRFQVGCPHWAPGTG